MSTEMNWSHDYCLYCDKQTTEGAYCSQACRVADRERSQPVSPLHFGSASATWQSQSQSYSLYRTSSSARLQTSPPSPRTLNSQYGYFAGTSSTHGPQQGQKWLSASSSRSSLSSAGGGGPAYAVSAQDLSEQTYVQLRDYSNSFDQTRDWKRRQPSS